MIKWFHTPPTLKGLSIRLKQIKIILEYFSLRRKNAIHDILTLSRVLDLIRVSVQCRTFSVNIGLSIQPLGADIFFPQKTKENPLKPEKKPFSRRRSLRSNSGPQIRSETWTLIMAYNTCINLQAQIFPGFVGKNNATRS